MKVEVRNLKKSFGDHQVLSGISFTCESGRALGLLGRNGAGKTTTIRTMLGIILKDDGEVLLDGKPVKPYNNSIGYLPEERGLYAKVKINEQLSYFAALRGIRKRDAEKAIDHWLERLDMLEYKLKTFETLSKGNQQKIQLVLALLHDPQLIILDEPFSGLDPVNAQLLKDVVMELKSSGKLIIFSSHQMNFVEEFCEDIVMIHKGELVLHGNLRDIKRSFERKKLFVRFRTGSEILDIKAIKGVTGITQADDGFILNIEREDCCRDVLKYIGEKNFDIDSFTLIEHNLNDIFIQKVGEDK